MDTLFFKMFMGYAFLNRLPNRKLVVGKIVRYLSLPRKIIIENQFSIMDNFPLVVHFINLPIELIVNVLRGKC